MARKNISEEKAKRIAVGATVGGVLLIVFLVIILVVQFVQIAVGNTKKANLDREIQQYEQMIEKGESDLNDYKTGMGLYYYARSLGWT